MIKTSKKSTLDYMALAIFFPAVIALAIVPTLMRATMISSDSLLMRQLFQGAKGEEAGPMLMFFLR